MLKPTELHDTREMCVIWLYPKPDDKNSIISSFYFTYLSQKIDHNVQTVQSYHTASCGKHAAGNNNTANFCCLQSVLFDWHLKDWTTIASNGSISFKAYWIEPWDWARNDKFFRFGGRSSTDFIIWNLAYIYDCSTAIVLQFKNIEELVDKTVPVDIRFQGEMDIQGSKGILYVTSCIV
jgi:hypothetical protein